MSATNIISDAKDRVARRQGEPARRCLDFLVTEEQLGVTLVSAAIENAPGTPSENVPPRLTQRRHYRIPPRGGAQGGRRQATDDQVLVPRRGPRQRRHRHFRDPRGHRVDRDQPLPDRRQRLRPPRARTSARACAQRRWAPRLSTARSYASHRANWARTIGPPNDVGFENFDWPTVARGPRSPRGTRHRLRGRNLTARQVLPDTPAHPLANGLGTPVDHTQPG